MPVEKNKRSGVSISFVKGNECVYSLSDPYSGQNVHITQMQKNKELKCHFDERGIFFINGEVYYTMSRGTLVINIQLFNSGDVPLDVLAIHAEDNLDLNHVRLYSDGIFLHGSKLRFPLHLEKGELVTVQSRHTISLGMGSTDGLFAADFRSLPKSIGYEVSVDTLDVNEKRQTHVAELASPSKSLVELYVNQWQEYGQDEYLVLSGQRRVGDI